MTTINPQNIWALSAIDKYLGENKNNLQLFNALFEKKKMIIELLQSKKLDAKKYKAIVVKAYKQESGDIKKCAELDLLKCKDAKDEQMVQIWFREMIENTGASYEEQEKQYSLNQKKAVANTSSQQSSSTVSVWDNQNIDAVSFKAIDNLLEQNQGKKEFYAKLLQRKQKLLNLVKSNVMTADKYKSALQVYMGKVTNEDILSDYKFELDGIQDFHDGNVAAWFKQIIEETTQKLDEQFQKLNSKSQPIAPKPIQKIQPSPKAKEQTQIKKNTVTVAFDINSITSFKVFDQQLDKLTGDKNKYRQVLAKKKKFIELSRGSLTAEKYKALLINSIRQAKNEQIKQSMEFQLSELVDFHDNNAQEWFKDIVSTSQILLEDQEAIMVRLQKGEKIQQPKEDSQDLNLSSNESQEQIRKSIKKQPVQQKKGVQQAVKSVKIGKLGMNTNEIYSLKALDEFMTEFQKDAEVFCACFERKETIFQMMKKGEITSIKYKSLQQTTIKSSSNEKLKEAAEMELFDLKDICDNNVDEWFENIVNDSGDNYEDQQVIYKKLKGINKIPNKEQSIQKGKPIMPNINQVVCFTAVSQLFQYCQQCNDIIYYRQLLTKRDRLLDLLSQKKLPSNKYRQINNATLGKTTNNFLKEIISYEQKLLADHFLGKEEQWFVAMIKNIEKSPPVLKLPENEEMKKVNGWGIDKKKKYLIGKMAAYQSLVRYYSSNQMSTKNNKYLQEYGNIKKEQVVKALKQLEKTPQLDIYNIAEQLFPTINQTIFYGDQLPQIKKRIDKAVQLLTREIAAIKDYAGKIKKTTNPYNLQDSKKQIGKCEENIKYLKSWPNNELVAFPKFKDEKVEKYNLDLIRYLQRNQIQIQVNHIEGLKQKMMFKIFVADPIHARFFTQVKSGSQNEVKTIVKLPVRDMIQIYRGEKKLIIFRIYEKGFFSKLTLIGQNAIQTSFIRNNILQDKIQVGNALINYTLRVQRPTKPLITEITHYAVTILPPFQKDPKVEEELLKQYCS